jgi:hypothetical protein
VDREPDGVERSLREGGVALGRRCVVRDPIVGESAQRVPELAVGIGQSDGDVFGALKLPTDTNLGIPRDRIAQDRDRGRRYGSI